MGHPGRQARIFTACRAFADGGGNGRISARLAHPPRAGACGPGGRNPNTMQRALAELEAQGLVETHRTSGRTVTKNGQAVEEMKQALARGCAGEYVKNMGRLGIPQPEAARMAAEYKEESV